VRIDFIDKTKVTEYSYNMGKQEKLLTKALNSPDGLSFSDFQTLMSRCGWVLDHQTGSHQIWYSPKAFRLSVQNRNGKAKGYQVRQFLARFAEENKHA
jgi:hypothetical protein